MIQARGVVAWLREDAKDMHRRTFLKVKRKGEKSFTFDLHVRLDTRNRLVFWGSKTDRFLLGTTTERFEAPSIFWIDLQERTCGHLCSFPTRAYMSEKRILSLTCSGSGRTIAALVAEGQSHETVSIHVASVQESE